MDVQALVDGILDGEIRPVTAPAEAEYHAAWVERGVGEQAPFIISALGGALSDRLA